MKKKYLFISNMAAPYQVKFCYSLQEYFDAEFWFYEYIDETRPEWWKIPLGEKCKVMKTSGKAPRIGYFSFGLFLDMLKFKPDIVVLGGFMKWHVLVLWFAKLLGAKVAIMSEPLRYVSSDDDAKTELISMENSRKKIQWMKRLFNKADLYIGMGEVAKNQMTEEFRFSKEKVTSLFYPMDIEEYFKHPLREKKQGEKFTLLFANRLVERYQPLVALEILKELSERYPNIELLMNADGPVKQQCLDYISTYDLNNVQFLDQIDSWNNMHLIYEKADILILPAIYSNGNMSIFEAKASGMGMVLSNKINHVTKTNLINENCFICNPEVNAFVDTISLYMENPDLLVSHGMVGRELVQEHRNDVRTKDYYDTFKQYGFID